MGIRDDKREEQKIKGLQSELRKEGKGFQKEVKGIVLDWIKGIIKNLGLGENLG